MNIWAQQPLSETTIKGQERSKVEARKFDKW
jgi:hypothetical protein